MLYYITHLKNPFDKVTDGVAALAVATYFRPSWHDQMEAISQEATIILPILGAGWLLIQIISKCVDKFLEWRGYRKPGAD